MIRNLKILGSSAVAVLVMSAMAASAASAQQGVLTSDGPVFLKGTEIAGKTNAIIAFGQTILCPGSTYDGEALGGGPIKVPATTGTLVPTLNNPACKLSTGLKATVHMNGCDVVIKNGKTVAGSKYEGTGELVCPEGKLVETEVFASAVNENIRTCTIKGGAQGGAGSGTLANTAEGAEVTGTINGIKASESGLCGTKTTEEAQIQFAVEVVGKSEAGAATAISVSD